MAEYIEREALGIGKCNPEVFENKGYANGWNAAIDIIQNAPAADVVPVVRCGECVFHEVADYGEGYTKNVCRLLHMQIQNDDFCSYGARKDGDGE